MRQNLAARGEPAEQPDSIPVQAALAVCFVGIAWGTFIGVLGFFLASWLVMGNCLLIVMIGAYGARLFIYRLYPKGWKEGPVVDYDV